MNVESESRRALIVDDNVALARVVQFALEGAGFKVEVAHNGREGLEAAMSFPFDIVITDQQMPEMTGLELCAALRETTQYADCPILLLTAKGLELELPRIQEEFRIEATFPKPFSPSAIVKAVRELLAVRV